MSQAAMTMSGTTSVRRPTARQNKKAMAISALVFFAAIAVVGGWGLSGIQTAEGDAEEAVPTLIFAGGAPTQASIEESVTAPVAEELSDDEYVIGDYGDPASELYADDDDGGWGDAALQSASDYFGASSDSGRGRRRN